MQSASQVPRGFLYQLYNTCTIFVRYLYDNYRTSIVQQMYNNRIKIVREGVSLACKYILSFRFFSVILQRKNNAV